MSSTPAPNHQRRLPQATALTPIIDADGRPPLPATGRELHETGRVRSAITYLVVGVLIIALALIVQATIGQAVARSGNAGAISTMTILVAVLILCGVLVALVGGGYHLMLAFMHVCVASLSVKQVEQQIQHADELLAMERQRQEHEAYLARTRLPADENGNRPFIYDEQTRAVLEITAGQFKQPVPSSIHWDYRDTSTRVTEEPPAQLLTPKLPERVLMLDVMRKWDLTLDNLFLGLGKGGQPIACSLDGFMHVAHDAPTGGGKTAQFYAEIIMLLKLGVRVILCHPHFAPVGKKGEDWRPIGRAIEAQGLLEVAPGEQLPSLIRRYENIAGMLKWLSTVEIDRRFTLQAEGDYSYTPMYLFVDEWPAVVRRHPQAAEYQVDVLQRGRAVEVCIDTNAQGFLQDDVDLKGSARENFNTAYHMGGSVYSGAKLLDLPVKEMNALLKTEQVALGKGIALLRNNEACPQAQLVRLPYAENYYAYYMLGRADDWQLPEFRARRSSDASVSTVETERETWETALEANGNIITGAFPVSRHASQLSTKMDMSTVSRETRETIGRLHKPGMPLREIASSVGLSGRKYPVFQAVCRDLGLLSERQA